MRKFMQTALYSRCTKYYLHLHVTHSYEPKGNTFFSRKTKRTLLESGSHLFFWVKIKCLLYLLLLILQPIIDSAEMEDFHSSNSLVNAAVNALQERPAFMASIPKNMIPSFFWWVYFKMYSRLYLIFISIMSHWSMGTVCFSLIFFLSITRCVCGLTTLPPILKWFKNNYWCALTGLHIT